MLISGPGVDWFDFMGGGGGDFSLIFGPGGGWFGFVGGGGGNFSFGCGILSTILGGSWFCVDSCLLKYLSIVVWFGSSLLFFLGLVFAAGGLVFLGVPWLCCLA